MDTAALYDIAKGFANKIRTEKPAIAAEAGGALCLVVSDDDHVFSAVTGIGVHDGLIAAYPAEFSAVAAMLTTGVSRAKQIMVISMEDDSVSVPCSECLNMLMWLDVANERCEAAVSEDRSVIVRELAEGDVSEGFAGEAAAGASDTADTSASETASAGAPAFDFFSGFGDNDASDGSGAAAFDVGFDESYFAPQHEPVKKNTEGTSFGAPAEYASSVTIDESNPFYAPPGEAEAAPVQSLADKNKEAKAEGAPEQENKNLSKADLLKQAKQMKKVAKANFNFFKNKQ
ncbi:MAG: hypothetical protein J1F11_03175 [Oscillospiraceae bacterium]|nr:hypothetical protein [Oscillospiraceae bacterium]